MSYKLKTSQLALISALLLLLGYVQSAQSATSEDDESKTLAKTDDLLNKGKAKAAAPLLRALIRSHPNNADAHMQLGAALASLVDNDNYDAAIEEEQLALKLDPKSFGARKILGHIYANLHKTQESINILKEACEIKPGSYAGHRDLAIAYLAAGKKDEAIDAFKKAIEIKPDSVEAHLKLAVLLSKKGDFSNAISEASKAVKLAENKAETHLALANIKLESGDSAGSIEPFKTAIEKNGFDALGCLNPMTAASALSGLGWAISKNGDKKNLEEAIADQKKAIKAYPGFVPAYIRMAELLHSQNKDKQAEAVYSNSLRQSGGDASIATSYAKFLAATGRKDEAKTILKKLLEKKADYKDAADALAAIENEKAK